MTLPADARRIIETLGLQPHPEGGWYVETLRDPDPQGGRDRSTAIYYLLAKGERSHWHRVDAIEIWHWHAGAPLELSLSHDDETIEVMRLGPTIVGGERPQGVVPQGVWQSARSTGAWTLVGCTVAPGFHFDGFELAPPDWAPGKAE
ncbi:cupin domain-containing protein [uncultured Maricaulis sp.]|uniref:cupin domain-containing protein n=1 Tax=uncultured Maricaulis sp. TaxID=174710 RepID=UPI002637055A|nr:cupin domain-containing protein [uncultured Maricaulis sp.]